jgi:thymidylate kinase
MSSGQPPPFWRHERLRDKTDGGRSVGPGLLGEIRNPKSEIRKKSEIRNPNPRQMFPVVPCRLSDFGFRVSFGFRISGFGFCSALGALSMLNLAASLEQQRHRDALVSCTLPPFAVPPPTGPRVVAIEGPNGAGKSTLCGVLARALGARACLGTDEAWFSDSFKTRMIRDADWFASAMFFLSGCFEQMRLVRVQAAPLVIMDRSLWSTLAVHAAENVERLAALLEMLRPVAGEVRVPDFTLVLRASFATCQSRIALKSGAARGLDELTANAPFHGREEKFYRWLGGQRPEVAFLDVDQVGPEAVAERALTLVRERIPC